MTMSFVRYLRLIFIDRGRSHKKKRQILRLDSRMLDDGLQVLLVFLQRDMLLPTGKNCIVGTEEQGLGSISVSHINRSIQLFYEQRA